MKINWVILWTVVYQVDIAIHSFNNQGQVYLISIQWPRVRSYRKISNWGLAVLTEQSCGQYGRLRIEIFLIFAHCFRSLRNIFIRDICKSWSGDFVDKTAKQLFSPNLTPGVSQNITRNLIGSTKLCSLLNWTIQTVKWCDIISPQWNDITSLHGYHF